MHLQVFSAAAECGATVEGAVGFQYSNGTQTLTLATTHPDRLVVTDASCGSAIQVGDTIVLAANYQLSGLNPKNNPLAITRP